MIFERRAAMKTLLADRPKNLFVVPGLGSCTWDAFAAGDDDRNFYLWGAMGGAAMIGLGLALAKPNLRVVVVTGDGEMLMGMGSLATVGVQKPKNLSILVLDNEAYGETGMQATHTAGGVDLAAIAKACGFKTSKVITKNADFGKVVHEAIGPNFLQIKVAAEKLPLVLPPHDGVHLKDRFRKALADVLPKKP